MDDVTITISTKDEKTLLKILQTLLSFEKVQLTINAVNVKETEYIEEDISF